MDPELQKLLVEIRALAQDNHDMLRLIRREAWVAFITKVIFWVVVIIAPIFFILPYLSNLSSSSSSIEDVLKIYQGQI